MITHHATLGASNIRHEKHEHNNSEIFTGDIMNQVYEGFFDNCFYHWGLNGCTMNTLDMRNQPSLPSASKDTKNLS